MTTLSLEIFESPRAEFMNSINGIKEWLSPGALPASFFELGREVSKKAKVGVQSVPIESSSRILARANSPLLQRCTTWCQPGRRGIGRKKYWLLTTMEDFEKNLEVLPYVGAFSGLACSCNGGFGPIARIHNPPIDIDDVTRSIIHLAWDSRRIRMFDGTGKGIHWTH